MFGTTLGVFFFSGILLLAPSSVLAQRSGSESSQRLASEYQQLRADLDRVNAEIAALKRGGRSVRTDYLVRDKLAEAEALARKVTAVEARLRAAGGSLPAETVGETVQTPVATPQDGAVEFEAKADLLSDQARRFRAEAEALAHTAEQIRARQALRRRAGAWERDPLAGFEASKRVAIIPAQGSHVTMGPAGDSNGAAATPRGTTISSGDSSSKAGGTGALGGASPPVTAEVAGPGTPTVAAPALSPAPAASHPLTAPAPLSPDSASKTGVQQRTLLDPATLAGIRGSLSQAGSLSDPEAVEVAATALRNHAQALEERARLLRARAR
jgi:cell division protein FtsB